MAICNVFKKLTKETGTFLTFGQYMDDLTEWQTKSKYYKIVPSKFIAIDNQTKKYSNSTLPKCFYEYFENSCACFKNSKDLEWNPEYSKILFWNAMFESGIITKKSNDNINYTIDGIKYVGDINMQSHNNIDGMGYSEIYCNIPNEASSYVYNMHREDLKTKYEINRETGDLLEGMQDEELNGLERLSLITPSEERLYKYTLDQHYIFSWNDKNANLQKTDEPYFNINIIVLLYDIWSENEIIYKEIPLGVYITGLVNESGEIQNSITKYVSNEDIYNSGTSYCIRVCSRYIVSPVEDNYIIKDLTCENGAGNSDLSRILTQLSISQNKMDEIIHKTYNTDQNYKQLLSIFKNSKTNTPYIKQVNDSSYWYINGKMIGPAVPTEGLFEPYTIDELLDIYNTKRIQAFLINVDVFDSNGNIRYIYENGTTENIIIKWSINYNGTEINPSIFEIAEDPKDGQPGRYIDYTNTNHFSTKLSKSMSYMFKAIYAGYETIKEVDIKFVDPIYFGELPEDCGIINSLGHDDIITSKIIQDNITVLQKYITDNCVGSYEITTSNMKDPGHVCYAYPQNLGELNFIIDDNGYVLYTNSDSVENRYICVKDVNINGVNYIVYVEKEPAVRKNQILNFELIKNNENK